MLNFRKGLIIACLCFLLNVSNYSQDKNTQPDSTSNYILLDYASKLSDNYYFTLLDSIKNDQSKDYFSLRMAYTKTKDYSPYDTEVNDSLKKVVSFMDKNQFDNA